MNAVKLNDELAIERKPGDRYLIFTYFEDEGEIKENVRAGSVILDKEAVHNLMIYSFAHWPWDDAKESVEPDPAFAEYEYIKKTTFAQEE